MTTAHPTAAPAAPQAEVVSETPVRRPLGSGVLTGWRALRDALDKPLASYYMLLGSSALLLTIGLIMVLSASSVRSFLIYDDSYAVVKRQLLWVVVGVPCAWVASRLPIRHIRRLAYPGFLLALVLLGLVAKFGVEINGNKNWLALGPFTIQPAEIAKLAIVLWAANIYAHKERRLRELHHLLVPVVPGLFAVIGLVLVGRDLGTALVLRGDPAGDALGGRCAHAPLRAEPVGAGRRSGRPGRDGLRAAPAHHPLQRPVQGLPQRRLAAGPRPLRPLQRRLVRPGHRRLDPEVGRPARGPHRLHLRRARRGARARRHAAGRGALLHDRVRLDPGGAAHRGPVRPLRHLRDRGRGSWAR